MHGILFQRRILYRFLKQYVVVRRGNKVYGKLIARMVDDF